ncbi:MAG: acyltransferase [Clostridia bacterium]|nr:acyltransferase [Clostridia bacterium]
MNAETKACAPLRETDVFSLVSKHRSAIMGIAALWILVFHEWIPLLGGVPGLGRIESFAKQVGFCGVDIFLFLSGIGLTYSIGKSSLPAFYYRRIRRIALSFLIVAVHRCIDEGWDIARFVGNVTGWNFWTKDIYSFLWFVPAVTALYLLFPLYWRFFSRSKNQLLFTVGALEVWLLLSLSMQSVIRYEMYGFTNRIPVFLLGIYAGWLAQNKQERHEKITFGRVYWSFAGITLALGAYLAYQTNYNGLFVLVPASNCCIPNLLIAVSMTFILAALLELLNRGVVKPVGKVLSAVLAFYGGFSLELYFVQEWLHKVIYLRVEGVWHPALVNLAMIAAATVCGWVVCQAAKLVWKLVDKLTAARNLKEKTAG